MSNKLLNQILSQAKDKNSSQIILNNHQNKAICSFLNQGQKQSQIIISKQAQINLIESFQILTNTLADDLVDYKRIKIKHKNKIYNCQFNFSLVNKEEKISLTLNEDKTPLKRITALGLNRLDLSLLKKTLTIKKGLILIASDSEQGKTTSYYSLLNDLNKDNKSFYSFEDYPSLKLPYINTLEITKHKTLTNYLLNIRKFNADVIGIDELKSLNDIKLALLLANQGYLVIATINSKDAQSALHAVLKTKLSPKFIANNLPLIIAQKLLRKNCPYCLKIKNPDPYFFDNLKKIAKILYKSKKLASSYGCLKCNFTSFQDKLAIFELMPILKNTNISEHFKPMIFDALSKTDNGVFSPEEIIKFLKS